VFGSGGVVDVSSATLGGTDAGSTDIAIAASAVYVAGYVLRADRVWRIEKRNLGDGALATGFGPAADGVVETDRAGSYDDPRAIMVDASSMYVAGLDAMGSVDPWVRVEKRDLVTGALVPGFRSPASAPDGVVLYNGASGSELIEAVTLSATTLYVAGSLPLAVMDAAWFVRGLSSTDGSTTSTTFVNPGDLMDRLFGIVFDGSTQFLVGSEMTLMSFSDTRWRIQSSLTSFGTGGVVVTNPTTGGDAAIAVAVDATAIYIAGCAGGQWRIEKRLR